MLPLTVKDSFNPLFERTELFLLQKLRKRPQSGLVEKLHKVTAELAHLPVSGVARFVFKSTAKLLLQVIVVLEAVLLMSILWRLAVAHFPFVDQHNEARLSSCLRPLGRTTEKLGKLHDLH